jgi:transposase-like protein
MPAERTAMRQVRDVLRLKTAGVAINEIARRVGVASSTVRLTLKRLTAAGLGWPLPAELTDIALEEQLFTAVGKKQGHRRLAEPDWVAVHREPEAQARHAADRVGRVHRAPPRGLPLFAIL